jgi:hypothetical protein
MNLTQQFDGLDDAIHNQAWLMPDMQKMRRQRLGLVEPDVAAFMGRCEFISLGCFCGVARSLQCIGLKTTSYPIDWVRIPVEGLIHCIASDFEDFFTFTAKKDTTLVLGHNASVFTSTSWGGSFWHHDPTDAKVIQDLTRRIKRLLGHEHVAMSRPRFFVWAANSSMELDATLRLYEALLAAYPPNAEIYLLVLIDLQTTTGFVRLEEEGYHRVLFARLKEDIFLDMGRKWTMEKQADLYSEAIAFAMRAWSSPSSSLLHEVPAVPNLRVACNLVDGFHAGSPTSDMYWPQRIYGQRLGLRKELDLLKSREEHTNGAAAGGATGAAWSFPAALQSQELERPRNAEGPLQSRISMNSFKLDVAHTSFGSTQSELPRRKMPNAVDTFRPGQFAS